MPTSLAAAMLMPVLPLGRATGANGSRRPLASYARGGSARPAPGSSGRTAADPGAGGGAGVAVGVGGLGGATGFSAPPQPPSQAARANAPTVARAEIWRTLIGWRLPEPAR